MKKSSSSAFLILSTLMLILVASLFLSSTPVTAQDTKGTPGPNLSTPEEGSGVLATRQAPETSFDTKNAGKTVSLEEIEAKYPAVKAFLEKFNSLDEAKIVTDLNYTELYNQLAILYKDYGVAGVGVFLEDSDLSYELDIPLPYYDILNFYQAGGFDAVFAQAKKIELLNEAGDLVGDIAIDPEDKLDAVKAEVTKLGLTVGKYDEEEAVLEVGIPQKLLTDLKTPDAVLKLFATIGNIDGVDEFYCPEPLLAKPTESK